nr:PREDICTED: zinc finger MYM-type protein 1-like [Daucus carota subsp. sativus]
MGDSKFCILVDEAIDVSHKEQMVIVLRFVDVHGVIRERYFDIVNVADTISSTLKKEISDVLTQNNLSIHNMRGQGYDGASNMRGAFNGLQALFLKDCPYAYYVHCFAHRLQLALVGAAEKQDSIWEFFSMLSNVVNIVTGSSKRLLELQIAYGIEVDKSVASGEREIGRGLNQIGNLQRPGSTRWSSHFYCVCSLIDKFGSIIIVLESINNCSTSSNSMRGEARGSLKALKSFDFVFVLHLMHKIMGITDLLCRALQSKSIDILNAMDLVATTKELLQSLRDEGFDILLDYVMSVCEKYDIDIPDMNARYMDGIRSVRQRDNISVEHHYHYDVFNSAIDFQLEELHYRFNDDAVQLLRLSTSLEPKNNFRLFDIENICTLVTTFYPVDFGQQEMYHLKLQLDHYKIDVVTHTKFQDLSTLSELCVRLVDTGKLEHYSLIYRLICLVLTLPVSTATTERVFSAMKLMKTGLRNKMEEEYLRDSMLINIEREYAENIDVDEVIDEFYAQKNHRVQLK